MTQFEFQVKIEEDYSQRHQLVSDISDVPSFFCTRTNRIILAMNDPNPAAPGPYHNLEQAIQALPAQTLKSRQADPFPDGRYEDTSHSRIHETIC